MTWIVQEVLTSIGAAVVGVATAFAGLVRFRAWILDRRKQARIDSATYMKEKASTSWERAFGEEQLRRTHFQTLTEIDRTTGHEAIRLLQQRLGADDRACARLRKVGAFLVATGCTARIRKPQKSDARHAYGLVVLSAAFATLSLCLLVFVVLSLVETDWTRSHFMAFVVPTLASLYAAVFLMLSIGCFARYTQFLDARSLYKELVQIGKAKRARSASARGEAKQQKPGGQDEDIPTESRSEVP